ncbi:hypothetical protein CEP54_015591 [Fusarium duplospermum]|uniref:Uncharacterized protein n=1 Tax=Fusarium duplospermum TaxID=1325734 RepID=A0A428NMU8_9HYPO|nr:hypothetical protein CEP54_015591 [Fusarium duplospermum]
MSWLVGAYRERAQDPAVCEVEREIGVLIWGTGFDMNDSSGHFQIYGKGGINLTQLWGDYLETYRSVTIANFPDLFLTLGPNSANY